MESISKAQIIKIKTLMGKMQLLPFSKDLAYSFSDGRTESVSMMYGHEAWALISHLEEDNGSQPKPLVKMQRKILSLAHEQQWKKPDGKIDMSRVNKWSINYGYLHKSFNDYTEAELPALVTQFEKMYVKHLKSV